ncbi:MAG: DUF393 domain-containing protein [Chitinophagaceae bacterium]|nr:DUF393 domain-containing protein [Chitinophagaceae bacterium]
MKAEELKNKIAEKYYVIFDGECGFCNKTALFLAITDTNNIFTLVSNTSVLGTKIVQEMNLYTLPQYTIVLIKNDTYWIKSQAIEIILSQLPRYKCLSYILHIIPSFISNFCYDTIALIRKKLFKNTKCSIPDTKIQEKIIL